MHVKSKMKFIYMKRLFSNVVNTGDVDADDKPFSSQRWGWLSPVHRVFTALPTFSWCMFSAVL